MMFEPIESYILYKYREDSGFTEDIIKNHALWFSSPLAFNDPFDCWSVVGYATDEQKNQTMDRLAQEYPFVKDVYSKSPGIVKNCLVPQKLKTCADNVFSQIRICSFSQKYNNIIMWSHYAQEHTGLCFMFDFSEDLLFLKFCSKVNYVSKITPSNALSDEGRKKLIKECVLSKYKDWSYEEEVRIMKLGNDIQSNTNGQLVQFNPKALKKIFFGCKATETIIEKYRGLCNTKDFQHVEFYKMEQLTDGTFGLKEYRVE